MKIGQSGSTFLLVVFVAALGIVSYLYLGKDNSLKLINQIKEVIPQQFEEGNRTQLASKGGTTSSPTAEAQVIITGNGFMPATLTVAKGQEVTFVNGNTNPHHITSFPKTAVNNLPGFDSETLQPLDSFTYTFEKTGTFSYADNPNSTKFKGQIIVQE